MQDAEYRRIPLTNRAGVITAWTLVDPEDFERFGGLRWHGSKDYARRNVIEAGHKRCYLLHREIMGLTFGDGLQADHINLDRLDNRRANLRVLTNAENSQNRRKGSGTTSRFRGVYWDSRNKCWRGQTAIRGRRYLFGGFKEEVEAACAVEAFRIKRMPYANPDPELAKILAA